jgi:hypothetical protein
LPRGFTKNISVPTNKMNKEVSTFEAWNPIIKDNHSYECTILEELVSNHIKLYITNTHEMKDLDEQNLEVVACTPLREVSHWGGNYVY